MRDELLEKVLELIALYLRLGDRRGADLIEINGRDSLDNYIEERIFLREKLWIELKKLLQKLHRL